jgi:translation initiation factor SUI1
MDFFVGPTDALDDGMNFGNKTYSTVHIRIQQRNGRKAWTFVENLLDHVDNDKKKVELLVEKFKKTFCCGGSLTEDPELGLIITLQGDHRTKIRDFLATNKIVEKEHIKVHG